MVPIIETSVGGRNIFVYEVAVMYRYVNKAHWEDYQKQIEAGKQIQPPAHVNGEYIRLFEAECVQTACQKASAKFDAFLQGQGGLLELATIVRCDLKFSGHVFS